jgi:hypothetical protein
MTILQLVHARARRRFQRGLKRRPMGLIKKLRKAKKEAPPNEKPAVVKTHLRDMIIVPEMIGSVVGIYNGKVRGNSFGHGDWGHGGVNLTMLTGIQLCRDQTRNDWPLSWRVLLLIPARQARTSWCKYRCRVLRKPMANLFDQIGATHCEFRSLLAVWRNSIFIPYLIQLHDCMSPISNDLSSLTLSHSIPLK